MNPRTARLQASRRLGSVRLDPARRVSIRQIDAFDRPALAAFYAGLSPESVRRRFLGRRELTDADIDAMVADDGLVAVLSARGPDDGQIVGHAQLSAVDADTVEAAFAVRDDLQGRGIGRALVDAAIGHARRRGWRRLTADTFVDNVAMRRLLRGAGCRVERDLLDGGVEEIVLRLVSDAATAAAPAR
ncbi:MAG TPA: GNAT family N-acetyltransferase [Candidatus Limnocylindria bacterium]|nr:GNAT family N-acetyltransferase [Candidatus Limnocylindria bacterium]